MVHRGLSFLLRLLPEISVDVPLPSIELPSIELPPIDLPLPSIDLPSLPGWVRAIAHTREYWAPILIGLAVAAAEYERRRRQRPGGSRRYG